jgi:hypothetical protein
MYFFHFGIFCKWIVACMLRLSVFLVLAQGGDFLRAVDECVT